MGAAAVGDVQLCGVPTRVEPVRSRLVRAALLCLAIPSMLQFAWAKSQAQADVVPAPLVRTALALRAAGRPGDVVLQRPGGRYPPLPISAEAAEDAETFPPGWPDSNRTVSA